MVQTAIYPLTQSVAWQQLYWAIVKVRVKATPGLSIIANGVTLNTRHTIPKVGIAQNCPDGLRNGRYAKRITNPQYTNSPYIIYPTYRGLLKALTKVIGQYPIVLILGGNYTVKVISLGSGLYGYVSIYHSGSFKQNLGCKPIHKARVTKTVICRYRQYRVPNPNYGLTAKQVAQCIASNALGLS